ncbi:MAG: hypothetical protein ACI4O7_02620 [Aristaeellaceae bacterium]
MKRRRLRIRLAALLLTCALGWLLLSRTAAPSPASLSGGQERTLLRIWTVSAVGGGESWLREQLRLFEGQHPGVMTYLRAVSPGELTEPEAVLPDLVLYTPGTFTAPDACFAPLAVPDGLREPLLRCGRWQTLQYGLPLCWGGYVLCIDGALEPDAASTPAPTTLLGRPAATPEASASPQPYPYDAAMASAVPLAAPGGCGTLALCCLLEPSLRPPLAEGFAAPAEVYAAFRGRSCASAVLTTGQLTALSSLASAGKGFAFRTMAPSQVITDQVWLGSVVRGAEESAAPALLAYLTGREAQQRLSAQGLYPAREGLSLYPSGAQGEIETAAARSLTAVNAYVPPEDVCAAAWQVYTGQAGLSDALLPLL